MKDPKKITGGALIAIAVIALIVAVILPNGGISPHGPRPSGPDLHAVFATNADRAAARQHAAQFAAICDAVGRTLEFDWKQPAEKRCIVSGFQVAVFRRNTANLCTFGERFSTTYTTLPDAVQRYLDDAAGVNAGPLSDEQSRNWLKAYKTLAECADYAARTL